MDVFSWRSLSFLVLYAANPDAVFPAGWPAPECSGGRNVSAVRFHPRTAAASGSAVIGTFPHVGQFLPERAG